MNFSARNPSTRIVVVAGAIWLGTACSETSSGSASPGQGLCLETITYPDDITGLMIYTRETWDDADRILIQESSRSAAFDMVNTRKTRYASHGRVITHIALPGPSQNDYRYDDHDNYIETGLSYPSTADPFVLSPAEVWIGAKYANEYEASGRLAASTRTPTGQSMGEKIPKRFVYTEDSAGRCTTTEMASATEAWVETRSYDGKGRLERIELVGGDYPSITTFGYDEKDRVSSWTEAVSGTLFPGTTTKSHTYLPDGSARIVVRGGTDVINAAYSIVTRTPACERIEAAIGSLPDARCRVMR